MNFPNSRILCIDDDTHTCDWIKIVLHSANVNATVTSVKTGHEAFTLLNRDKFDLCILEYALPDMTGVQLCSLMRQMGSRVPMMFFTAMNRPIDREKAAAAGASEYICKPDDLNLFVDAVTHLLKAPPTIYFENRQFASGPNAANYTQKN